MLELVKVALRISPDITAYDEELNGLIASAQADLGIAGVIVPEELDDIVKTAVVTYCKINFGTLENGVYDRFKKSYDEQKAQLVTATGYTNWRKDPENV